MPEAAPELAAIETRLREGVTADLTAAYQERQKTQRHEKIGAVKARLAQFFPDAAERELAGKLFKEVEKDIVRGAILETGLRIDGRDTKTVRPIAAEVGVLPRAHGSALPGRAGDRRARGRVPREFHAAL